MAMKIREAKRAQMGGGEYFNGYKLPPPKKPPKFNHVKCSFKFGPPPEKRPTPNDEPGGPG